VPSVPPTSPAASPLPRSSPRPQNGTLSSISLQITGTGSCSTPVCSAGALPLTLKANTPVTCTYTCDEGVTKVAVATDIDSGAGAETVSTATAASVTTSTSNGPTACVVLSDQLFKTLEPGTWT
jgi:hypothetical protein